MRIGIDARQVSHSKRHGLRTYVENLLKALSRCDNENDYFIYVDNKNEFLTDNLNSNFHVKVLPWSIKYFSTLLNDHYRLPCHIAKDGLDIIHFPANPINFRADLISPVTVITVHDAIPLFAVKSLKSAKNLQVYLYNWYNSLLINHASKRDNLIITISETSKKDLTSHTRLSPDQITVIHEAANDSFKVIDDRGQIEKVKRKFNLSSNFILGFAHKNGELIASAFDSLPSGIKTDYRVGLIWLRNSFPKRLRELITKRGLGNKIICIPPVSEEDLVLLFNSASVFVFPSFYEGFGLPVVEAMNCGCPVICSDRGALPEVCGNAAVFIKSLENSTDSVIELSGEIARIITDTDLRETLTQKGMKQAEKYSWDKTARQTQSLYEKAYDLRK